jgi:hypothetical protein
VKDWTSDQRGVGGTGGVTAGPAGWGWFNAHYDNTDRTYSLSHTHIFSSSLVNEAQAGARRQSENFRPVGDEDFQRLSRTGAGYTLGQFHPELNPIDALPKVTFGGSATPNPPNFTYDNRIVGDGGVAWVHSFNDNLTWIKGSHAFKGGLYFEHLYNTEGPGFSAPASFAGQYDFTVDTNNPLDTGYSFANALLGNYRSYSEIDALPEVNSHRYLLESYLQDTWKVSRRLTLDYGVRLPVVQALVHEAPRRHLRSAEVRPLQGPASLSARPGQQRERRARSRHRRRQAQHLRRQLRARARAIPTTAWS